MTVQTVKLRRPCENRPWRVDAPRGYWDPQHFVDMSNALPKEMRPEVPCQGWIRVMSFDAIGVRLLVMRGQATFDEVEDKDGPELFPTFTAMMRANKIPLPRRSKMVPVRRSRMRTKSR